MEVAHTAETVMAGANAVSVTVAWRWILARRSVSVIALMVRIGVSEKVETGQAGWWRYRYLRETCYGDSGS